jgi:tRNA A-37 threonylcarbamoyl transferase component Bud32
MWRASSRCDSKSCGGESVALTAGMAVVGAAGTYRVSSRIQEGGMASIFEGWSDGGKPVVIKAPRIVGDGNDDVRLEKLKVEARILKGIDHEGIVHYVDEEDQRQDFYLVLERVVGRTLKEVYAGNPLSEAEATRFAVQLLRAVQHLHHHNIIHRDINHKNVLVDGHGKLTLVDFGAAKEGYLQVTPSQGTIMYTPGWEPPEARAGAATYASDLYGVGAVLFFLLTGVEPREYLGPDGRLVRAPHEVAPGIGTDVSNVVYRAMQAQVGERFGSAADMIAQLTTGRLARLGAPHLVVLGENRSVEGEVVLGRAHAACGRDCRARGFARGPEVALEDGENYVSKHHARVGKDPRSLYFVEDLGSLNGTAVSRDGGLSFERLASGSRTFLRDNDVVALAHSPAKGPYVTVTFRTV